MKLLKGYIFAILSAVIYGLMPPMASYIYADGVNAMTLAALDGDFDTASALQIQLQPLIELLFCEVNPIPVKAAMKLLGYDCGEYRLPLTNLTEENRRKLAEEPL